MKPVTCARVFAEGVRVRAFDRGTGMEESAARNTRGPGFFSPNDTLGGRCGQSATHRWGPFSKARVQHPPVLAWSRLGEPRSEDTHLCGDTFPVQAPVLHQGSFWDPGLPLPRVELYPLSLQK